MEWTRSTAMGKHSKEGLEVSTSRKPGSAVHAAPGRTLDSCIVGENAVPNAAAVISTAGPNASAAHERQEMMDENFKLRCQHQKDRRIINNLLKELQKRTAKRNEARKANGEE